jgi:HD-like signal output (HDOD) protein
MIELDDSAIAHMAVTDEDLPAAPPLARRALRLTMPLPDDAGCAAEMREQLETLLREDRHHPLACRLIRAASGMSPSPDGRIPDLAAAIERLGAGPVRDLILLDALSGLYEGSDPYFAKLWNHALGTGLAAHVLAGELGLARTGGVFLAGCLHDVGKAIVHRKYPTLYRGFWPLAKRRRVRLIQVEQERFPHLAHARIGWRLACRWGLGREARDAILLHHAWERGIPQATDDPAPAALIGLASAIVNNVGINAPVCSWEALTAMPAARYLGVTRAHLRMVCSRIHQLFYRHAQGADNLEEDEGYESGFAHAVDSGAAGR